MTINNSGNNANGRRWEVYRFELVFFNSRENRWQLFQESTNQLTQPTGPQGFYRRQIYSMLKDMRDVFRRKFKDTIFACASPANPSVTVDLTGLGEGFATSKAENCDRQAIVKDIRSSWKAEGLENAPKVDSLLHAIEQATYGKCYLQYHEALGLMTCLPFRRPWDIYGRIDAFQPDFLNLAPVLNTPFFTLSLHKFLLPGELRQLARLRGNAKTALGAPDWRTY